jgi:serine/threonine-protein kinase
VPGKHDHTRAQQPAGPTDALGPLSGTAGPGVGPGAVTLGDFRLLDRVGAGGMGIVYKAQQISLDREVALKVLFHHLAQDGPFVQRFYREARLMAHLDHPHIVRGYGLGENQGWHYCAMEYVDGESLQGLLKRHGRLSVGDALHLALTVADALDYAHGQKLVHRDIKPANVLLTRQGVVKVADLGLAKALDEDLSLTQTGTGAGTPFYMAPEQARDAKRVDGRSDIYSLGCMLYQLLTGELPFQGETAADVLFAKEQGKFAPARRFNSDVPDRLDLILDKMMARQPDHRYPSCAELRNDLEALGLAHAQLSCLASAACTIPPATGPTRAKKPARPSGKAPAPPEGEETDESFPDWWYVIYKTSKGKLVKRRLTTGQVSELVKQPGFDLEAQGSHSQKGPFRSLATYREFQLAFRARLAKAQVKNTTSKYQRLYDQYEVDERRWQRWRKIRNLFRGAASWVLFLLVLAVVAAGAYLGYLAVRYGFQWLSIKLESMTN